AWEVGLTILSPGRPITREILGGKLIQIVLPIRSVVAPKIEQVVPIKDPRRMKIIEHESHGVIADRQHLNDLDIPLSGYGLALLCRMPLHFCAWAVRADILRRKTKSFASLERDIQGLAPLWQAKCGRQHFLTGH